MFALNLCFFTHLTSIQKAIREWLDSVSSAQFSVQFSAQFSVRVLFNFRWLFRRRNDVIDWLSGFACAKYLVVVRDPWIQMLSTSNWLSTYVSSV